jgi:hypothetical protein
VYKKAKMEQRERIEQLFIRIKEQEKIYALALKMKRDYNSLKNIRANICNLKEELQQLSYVKKEYQGPEEIS